ncbi:MAG TPA: flagellar FlbD family protein [Bacteroidota bacterium]|nr:flagellar FlbD family protein [Bacteroidota bacterium]
MIELHRLQNQPIVINADLIEFLESTPDTIVSTTTGKKIIVKESVDEVMAMVIQYKRGILFPKKRKPS